MIFITIVFIILGGGVVLGLISAGCIHLYEKYQSAKEKKQCNNRAKKYREIKKGKELADKILLDKFGKDVKDLINSYGDLLYIK